MLVLLQRELQREARRARAFLGRVASAGIGFACAMFLLLISVADVADGRRIFYILTFAGFGFCLIQGVRVAAGSIADEKRDGTLGLLLLTPLGSPGIVVGKFFAVGIPLIQPFLAFIPAIAITALLGGVTGGEILRSVAVVSSALVFSVAAGLCVSAFSRRNETSGRGALALLAACVAGPLLLAQSSAGWFRHLSPWTAFQAIADERHRLYPDEFWLTALGMNYAAIALLILAILFLPKRWEEACRAKTSWPLAASRWLEKRLRELGDALGIKSFAADRDAVLDRSPAEWLALRDGRNLLQEAPFLLIVFVLTVVGALDPAKLGFFALSAATVVLLAQLASQASFPLCNARQTGAMELLLCTPLDPFEIVGGQVAALRRQFVVPICIILGGGFFYSIGSAPDIFEGLLKFGLLALYFGTWVVSIGALGIFVGLLEKSPAVAFFQTILIGVVVAGFLSVVFMGLPFYLLLGFCGNRLAGAELPRLLKRPVFNSGLRVRNA